MALKVLSFPDAAIPEIRQDGAAHVSHNSSDFSLLVSFNSNIFILFVHFLLKCLAFQKHMSQSEISAVKRNCRRTTNEELCLFGEKNDVVSWPRVDPSEVVNGEIYILTMEDMRCLDELYR